MLWVWDGIVKHPEITAKDFWMKYIERSTRTEKYFLNTHWQITQASKYKLEEKEKR